MKIFSNGSSFASGSYPKYLAELLSADLTNISTPGYSNRSIWRTTIEFNPQNYDLAVYNSPLGQELNIMMIVRNGWRYLHNLHIHY